MSVSDRHAHGYEPRFDVDGPFGHQGELWYLTLIDALEAGSHEVKTDAVFADTRNLFIEFEHDPGHTGTYRPSGISVTTAEFWVFKLGQSAACLVMSTELLRALVTVPGVDIKDGGKKGSCPTHGYVLPFAYLVRAAAQPPETWA